MKLLLLVMILTNACHSFYGGQHHKERQKVSSDSMMHGWKFENHRKSMGKVRKSGIATNGKKLYEQNCLKCHAKTGKGDGAAAKMLDARPADLTKSDFYHKRHFFYVISEGNVHGMPAWKSVLSNTQIADIISYIRTLK